MALGNDAGAHLRRRCSPTSAPDTELSKTPFCELATIGAENYWQSLTVCATTALDSFVPSSLDVARVIVSSDGMRERGPLYDQQCST